MDTDSLDWREHIALLIGALSTSVIAVRILEIAGFNPQTAYAVLKSVGTSTVVVGTIISSLWIPTSFVYIYSVYTYTSKVVKCGIRRVSHLYVAAVAGVFILLTTPVYFVMLLIFLPSTSLWVALVKSGLARRSKVKRAGRKDYAFRILKTMSSALPMYIIFVIVMILFSEPWLPLEKVKVGSTLRIGYVLDTSDSVLTILHDDPRHIEYLNYNGQVLSRQICRYPDDLVSLMTQRSVVSFFAHKSYPTCTTEAR